ncbi:MAG: methyltransferase domain-containing protein [Myxococcales bacterium]|nr:methyltransferase domain-containing protein [Myxococcales bacterium]
MHVPALLRRSLLLPLVLLGLACGPSGDAASPSSVVAAAPAAPGEAGEGKHGEHGEHAKHGEHGEHAQHGDHGEHGEHGHAHGEGPLGGSHRHHGGHHRFDDPAKWAKEFDSPERLAWQKPDAVVSGLGLADDAVVADLGAGTGTFAVRLARAVPRGKVLANDVEASMVEYLGQRARDEGLANLVAVQGSADDPSLPEDIDLAFMCDVFHHIEDVPGFFGKVHARLRPDGRLVIVDFKKDAPDDAPGPPAAMRVDHSEVVKRLTDVGFRVVNVDVATLEYQYIVEMRRA